MDLGVLLSIPLDSVAVRAVLATLLGVVLARILLRRGLRAPRARAASALAPATALVVVLLLSGMTPQLPIVMLPAEAGAELPIPVRHGYVHFAPMAVPVLLGAWALVAGGRLLRRSVSGLMLRTRLRRLLAAAQPVPRVAYAATQAAAALGVATPRIATPPTCPSGAYVAGVRRPVLVVGRDLVDRLDADELDAVIAHELAHIHRRDLLVAGLLGVLRDVTFFVPGGGWALRQLHGERELAADQVAVQTTGRPGALASGLLKVLDAGRRAPSAAVTLVPHTTVVDRIRFLVEDRPRPSAARRNVEFALVAVITTAAVVGALIAPALLAESGTHREALALVWSAEPAQDEPAPSRDPRAFSVYRQSELGLATTPSGVRGQHAERLQENRRATLRACADAGCQTPSGEVSLGLQPPTVRFDASRVASWQVTPVGGEEAADGFQVFWLARQAE